MVVVETAALSPFYTIKPNPCLQSQPILPTVFRRATAAQAVALVWAAMAVWAATAARAAWVVMAMGKRGEAATAVAMAIWEELVCQAQWVMLHQSTFCPNDRVIF
ncbi:MAG: hypothetical protein RR893_03370 [Clostridia bacterium]